MNSSFNDYEKRIFDALDAYKHGHLPFLSAAAVAYQINPCTLQRRVKTLLHNSRGGHNKPLTSGQESALCEWLEKIIQLGFSPRLDLICSRANLFLADPSYSNFGERGERTSGCKSETYYTMYNFVALSYRMEGSCRENRH